MKKILSLLALACAPFAFVSCTTNIDPDGSMSRPATTTTTTTAVNDNPYILGDRSTTTQRTTSYR